MWVAGEAVRAALWLSAVSTRAAICARRFATESFRHGTQFLVLLYRMRPPHLAQASSLK